MRRYRLVRLVERQPLRLRFQAYFPPPLSLLFLEFRLFLRRLPARPDTCRLRPRKNLRRSLQANCRGLSTVEGLESIERRRSINQPIRTVCLFSLGVFGRKRLRLWTGRVPCPDGYG